VFVVFIRARAVISRCVISITPVEYPAESSIAAFYDNPDRWCYAGA